MTYTTSFHNGHEVSRPHNKRDKNYIKSQNHIIDGGYFEVWKDIPLGKAYQEIFGAALKEYNEKQTRRDRKIRSYLDHIKKDKQKFPVYECIFQIGNEKQQPDLDTCRKVLKDFADGFEKRNPNFKVVGVYFHADEKGSAGKGGTPHVHLDYVPVGVGFQKGLKVQNSVAKALENMGFRDIHKQGKKRPAKTAQTQWSDRERQVLTALCKSYGLEIENPKRDPREYENSKIMKSARDLNLKNAEFAKQLEIKKNELTTKQKNIEDTIDLDLKILSHMLYDENNKPITKDELYKRLEYTAKTRRELNKFKQAFDKACKDTPNLTVKAFLVRYNRSNKQDIKRLRNYNVER